MYDLQIYLPPPANWQDFQLLIGEIAKSRYNPDTVIEYGRQGQKQNGVDVYAEDRFGRKIGIQCKETKGDLEKAVIEAEADEAKGFAYPLDLFIVATTDRTDTGVQQHVFDINGKKKYGFTIRVDFWDYLVNEINRYALVLNSCYRSYQQELKASDEVNHLSCLRIAFNRPAFTENFAYERSYPDFEEALVTTKRLFRTGFTMDRWLQIPVVQTIPVEFLPAGEYRTFVEKLEAEVEKIYKTYIKDKSKIAKSGDYGQARAGHYNKIRGSVLSLLNDKLSDFKLPPIPFDYS